MKKKDKKKNILSSYRNVLNKIIILLTGIVIGYLISIYIVNSNLGDVIYTYNSIRHNYYKKIDDKKLSQAAINGMLSYVDDPNTTYLDNKDNDKFNDTVTGSFVGIGVTIQYMDDYNTIIKVNKNGPADKAGLKKNDVIIKVDGKDCKGLKGDDISKLIKGKRGTKVDLLVKRGKKKKKITVVRGKIEIDTVYGKTFKDKDSNVGYISISTFSSNTYKQFNKELKKQESKKIDSLIIDLRSNPGGQLNQATKILSMFFDRKTVLYQIVSKNNHKKKVYSRSKESRKYPVTILVNEYSASASEIITSCFLDNYRSINVVGSKTYGKGSVQNYRTLFSGRGIKYTIEGWLTSKGKSIDGKGIKPNYEVELSDEYFQSPSYKTDNQFQKALELSKKSH